MKHLQAKHSTIMANLSFTFATNASDEQFLLCLPRQANTAEALLQPVKQEQITPITNRTISVTKNSSPMFDTRYGEPLSSLLGSPTLANPLFSDLQTLLANDCSQDLLPTTLLDTVNSPPGNNIYKRECQLYARFKMLEKKHSDQINELSSFYRYQSSVLETERYDVLNNETFSDSYKDYLNIYYDTEICKIIDRVEKSIAILEQTEKETIKRDSKGRQISRNAIRMMEQWYEQHLDHPYPTVIEYEDLACAGDINISQVKKWFANKRNRSNNTRPLNEIAREKRQRLLYN